MMMNFMGSSTSNRGFYDEAQMGTRQGMLPFGYSSSSSPPSQRKGMAPLNFHHQFIQRHNNQDDDVDEDLDHAHVTRGDTRDLITDALGGRGGVGVARDVVIEREHMFDKVVTPSDVGKLNRLVIPKQHAERYFPLDSSANEKGLLLNFEDSNGKPWRFRYSYWNSSQSYVMTKGWSRFVKEKRLDAGDTVSFHRGVGELGKDRLFIEWRRRIEAPDFSPPLPALPLPHHFPNYHPSIHAWNHHPLFLQPPPPAHHQILHGHGGIPYGNCSNVVSPCSSSVLYFRSAEGTGGPPVASMAGVGSPQMVQVQRRGSGVEAMVFDSVPVVQGKSSAAAKRFRLFGVNMECPMAESDECDSTITTHSAMAINNIPCYLTSSSPNDALQLRPYIGTPIQTTSSDLLDKGKSSMSLDLEI